MIIKEYIRRLLYIIKKKPYCYKTHNGSLLETISRDCDNDFFYGYYDHVPEKEGRTLFHEMNNDSVSIILRDMRTGREKLLGVSKAFNWQMGARTLWINSDIISYNDFDGEKYVCRFYSLKENNIIRTYIKPLQDYSNQGYYLGVNYQRLRSYAKEYGYYCLPKLSDKDFDDYGSDGIWKIDTNDGSVKLLLTIRQIMNCEKEERFAKGKHFVNHIMISPEGFSFIFIHRYYIGKKRYDRLMYYDFKKNVLKCLMNDKMQSHYCWLDNQHVFGYGGHQGRNGFHSINVITGLVERCEELTQIHPKDGHPTMKGNWIVIDSYPNLGRMQELVAYNLKTKKIIKLLEVFHDLKHKGFSRCDLHPRISDDCKRIYFDTIYQGKRELCLLDVSKVLL